MNKIWVVAEFEFLQTVKRWQFLLITLALPCLLAFLLFISYKSGNFARSSLEEQFQEGKKILVEDNHGFFKQKASGHFESVDSLEQHQGALLDGSSLGYLRLTTNYLSSAKIDLIIPQNRALGASRTFVAPTETLLRHELLREIGNGDRKKRVFDTVRFQLHILDSNGEVNPFDYHLLVTPALFLVLFILSQTTASTFLLQSVSEEKENRTIEILLSTIKDTDLIAGKIIGLGGAALLQVAIWAIMVLCSLTGIAKALGLSLHLGQVPPHHLLYALTVFFLGFMFFAALMIAVGSLAVNFKDAQQLSTVFILFSFLPVYVIQILINDVHGNLTLFLNYLPFSAPIVLTTRFCLGNIPVWESALGLAVLLGFTLGMVVLAASCFRLGSLLFHRRPSLKEFFLMISLPLRSN
jgi:ABC-2 type transport system permease protein